MIPTVRLRTPVLVLCLAFVLAALSVHLRGALVSGVGSLNDEPAHYATSMMARDYLLGGDWFAPLDYARDWYLHYPKIALGQWPPMLYALIGVWMALFGVSGTAAVLGMAFLTACCATVLFRWLETEIGARGAGVAMLLFLCLPLVQEFSGALMTEVPLALFCTLAVLAYGRYLDRGGRRDALAFGLFAVAGILTKGNALALGMVPLLALVFTRRFELLRSKVFWLPAVLVLVICAPWYSMTAEIQARSWSGGTRPNLEYSLRALPSYLAASVRLGGWGLLLAAAFGLFKGCRDGQGKNGVWIASAGFFLGLLLLLVVLPSDVDGRHLVLATPLVVGCAVYGVVRASKDLGLAPAWGLALLLGLFGLEELRVVRKDFGGYREPVMALLRDPLYEQAVIMVAGDAIGEGLVIAGGAAADSPRPRHYILRASKVLISDDWNGRDYQLHFRTLDEMQARLEAFPVALLVLDSSTNPAQWFSHHTMLDQLVQERRDAWELLSSHDVRRQGEVFSQALRIYRLINWQSLPKAKVHLHTSEGGGLLQDKDAPEPLIVPGPPRIG
jgi:hypothetical protein